MDTRMYGFLGLGLASFLLAYSFGIFTVYLIRKCCRKVVQDARLPNYLACIQYLKWPIVALWVTIDFYSVKYAIELPQSYADQYDRLAYVLAVFLFTWFAVQSIRAVAYVTLHKPTSSLNYNLDKRILHTRVNIIMKLSLVLVIVIGTAVALMTFPTIKQLGFSILASAGATGIIIGIAAQKTLANTLAGIQIAITQPIKIGDTVIVENEWGTIEEITLTYVVICVWDYRRLIIPINHFLDRPFQNLTRSSADLIGSVMFEVDYQMPVAAIRQALASILEKCPLWDGKVANVAVTDVKAHTMELRILVSAKNASALWDLRCFVRESLVTFLQNHHPDCLPVVRVELKQ